MEITAAVGALAELAALFYQTLINHKVPDRQAAYITGQYLKGIMQAGSPNYQED